MEPAGERRSRLDPDRQLLGDRPGTHRLPIGLGQALADGDGRSARIATWLAGTFGASMLAAAIFRPDPALGFPVGTPDAAAEVTTSGILHFACAGIGFVAIAVACFVVARRFAAEGSRGMARFSRITGVAFFAGFACVASGGGNTVANLIFTAAVVLVRLRVDRRRRDQPLPGTLLRTLRSNRPKQGRMLPMILEVRTYRLHPGTSAEFVRVVEDEALPLLLSQGVTVVDYGASLVAEDGLEHAYLIRAFDSLAERDEQEEAFYGGSAWRDGPREAIMSRIVDYRTVVLDTTAEAVAALTRR